MENSFLSQLERNLEVQASGILAVQREDLVLAQARGELAQLQLVDRLRAKINTEVRLKVISFGVINGTLTQVYQDHLLLECNSQLWLIDILSLRLLTKLERSIQKPNIIEKNWTKLSSFRDWMCHYSAVNIYTSDGDITSGNFHKLYKDHFELKTSSGVISIYYHDTVAAQRSND